METIHEIKMPLNAPLSAVKEACAAKVGLKPKALQTFRIIRRSVDARRKNNICYVYSAEYSLKSEPPFEYAIPKVSAQYRPIVVGFGPAGMLAALVLARAGLCPIVLERGEDTQKRKQRVDLFRSGGALCTQSNAQFGAGGAGAFSDGKLTTGIGEKDKCRFITELFVKHGASADILIDAKPHIGTDKLLPMVDGIIKEICELGGEVVFSAQVTGISADNGEVHVFADKEYISDSVVLAIGHSARDTYKMLYSLGLTMTGKPFAMGFRIEHLQKDINKAMYGEACDNPLLPPADYKVVKHTEYGGVYSFCMCPGGFVTATSSEEGGVVTNGMSYSGRDGANANSALLTSVDGGENPFDCIEKQRQAERLAFELGGGDYRAPCQLLGDFVNNRQSVTLGRIKPTYTPGITFARLDKALPENVFKAFKTAFAAFDSSIKGFACKDALLTGFETRSSSPLRLIRNELYSSVDNPNLYPCGEGCGYAGGIMSAAVDGMRIAEAIIAKYKNRL